MASPEGAWPSSDAGLDGHAGFAGSP